LRAATTIVVVATLAACTGAGGGAQQQQVEFAAAAAADNILTTDYSALVEISGVRVTPLARAEDESDQEALVRTDYSAAVLETYLGEEHATVVFSRYAATEDALEDPPRGTWIVSLCRDPDGSYYLPGVGYELPAHEAVVAVARQTRARLADRELSLRRDAASYACLPDSKR
jgi:hypothetical protein